MCPTWGVVHNQRQYPTNARAMALEAGGLMHQVYAMIRIWQLEHVQKLPKHAQVTAERIFTATRYADILSQCDPTLDQREYLQQLAFATLHTSDWLDDPNDNVRTMTNMEMSAIHYIDERLPYAEIWPIYVADTGNPKCLLGIEQVFDVVLYYSDGRQIRYIGTIDGLVYSLHRERYYLDENKTASRLDAGWRDSFEMAHQVTGYCAAGTATFNVEILSARVTGAKIKPTNRGEDVHTLEAHRDAHAIQHWASWVYHTVKTYEMYRADWEHAPRYTHSCNRYFRPCSLLSFCCDTPDGRKEQWSQMVDVPPSPSEKSIQEL